MSLRQLYEQYHKDVQFLMIYIREAHPKDGWWFGDGVMGKMVRTFSPGVSTEVYDPKTIEERRGVARQCAQTLGYGIGTYVDEIDDPVSQAYAAMPTRLYLIGLDGRVVYAGGLGPFGFDPGALKEAIVEYLSLRKSP